MAKLTQEQFVAIAKTLFVAIGEAKEIPAGHLYARVMNLMSLETFNDVIDVGIKGGLIKRSPSHLLIWIK